jgi:aminoglycoside phosphotransferase (APT) family kinase protein
VQTWVPGTAATVADPGGSVAFVHELALLVKSLRAIPTRGRSFSGGGRGGDLQSHDSWMETCFSRSEGLLDVAAAREAWEYFRELPRGEAPDVMAHGDLVPGNVLVARGRLVGTIDVGGFAPADPALDLVAAWHLLEAGPRQVFRDDLGCDDLEWERGRAWAFQQAMGLVWSYVRSNPAMSWLGRSTLGRVLEAGN